MPHHKDIEKLVEQIVQLVDPLEIILFGSHARGYVAPDSDIDLLIVMPDGTHRRDTAMRLYGSVKGVRTPYDLVVATENDLEKYKNDIGYIYISVIEDGVSIWKKESYQQEVQ